MPKTFTNFPTALRCAQLTNAKSGERNYAPESYVDDPSDIAGTLLDTVTDLDRLAQLVLQAADTATLPFELIEEARKHLTVLPKAGDVYHYKGNAYTVLDYAQNKRIQFEDVWYPVIAYTNDEGLEFQRSDKEFITKFEPEGEQNSQDDSIDMDDDRHQPELEQMEYQPAQDAMDYEAVSPPANVAPFTTAAHKDEFGFDNEDDAFAATASTIRTHRLDL